ncbi:MAG: hypothetical protein AVDCRST_MAG52-1522, partial [uncultured Blastococcus sp.]
CPVGRAPVRIRSLPWRRVGASRPTTCRHRSHARPGSRSG